MSIIKKLVEHTSIYIFAEVVVMAGGLISFPIITRLLTKDQYGAMTLITISIGMVISLSTLGLNHSALRFHSEYEESKETQSFYSTLIIGSFGYGLFGTVFAIVAIKLLSIFHIVSFEFWRVSALASLLIIIRIMFHIVNCIYRAREHPWAYFVFSILNKYVPVGLIVLFLALWSLGVFGYYLGLVVGELAVLTGILIFFIRQVKFSVNKFSFKILKRMTIYGSPLVLFGFAGGLLSSSDRYLIGYFLTKSDVAIYSVAINLCSYFTAVLVSGFQYGFTPLIMKQMNLHALNETHLEIQRVIRLYCMVAFPLVVGLCVVGKQMILILASGKYSEAFYVLPYVAIASVISGLVGPLTLGLYFFMQTKKLAILMVQAAILNVLMNLVLIPRFGLYGAAISTLFCYLLLLVVGSIESSKYFRIKIPWHPILIYGICALLMYIVLKTFNIFCPDIDLFTQVGIGVISYISFLFGADKKLRRVSLLQIQRLFYRWLV